MTVIVLISEDSRSPQLESIIQSFKPFNPTIFYIGTPHDQLFQNLTLMNTDITCITPTRRWLSLTQLFHLFVAIANNPSHIIFASGYVAHSIGIFSGFILRKEHRVYVRHFTNPHHKLRFIHWWVLDITVNLLSTRVICVSPIVKNLLNSLEFVPLKKLVVIENGVDLKELADIRKHRTLEFETENLTIIVSRQVRGKGILDAIEGFRKFVEKSNASKLYLYGSKGELTPEINKRLNNLPVGISVNQGRVSDYSTIYGKASVIIHAPEDPNYESFGLVYIEALAAGLQCIFTRAGILQAKPIEFPEEHIWFVDFGDTVQIQHALEQIFERGKLLPMIPLSSLSKYSITTVATSYFSFMQNLD